MSMAEDSPGDYRASPYRPLSTGRSASLCDVLLANLPGLFSLLHANSYVLYGPPHFCSLSLDTAAFQMAELPGKIN